MGGVSCTLPPLPVPMSGHTVDVVDGKVAVTSYISRQFFENTCFKAVGLFDLFFYCKKRLIVNMEHLLVSTFGLKPFSSTVGLFKTLDGAFLGMIISYKARGLHGVPLLPTCWRRLGLPWWRPICKVCRIQTLIYEVHILKCLAIG